MNKKYVTVLLPVILFCAVLLRIPMVTTGLPYLFHPDEYGINNAAFENVKFDRLDTRYYLYPYYVTYAYTAVDYLVFKSGILHKEQESLEPMDFYLANRLTSLFFSLISIVLIFILVDMIAGNAGGLLAAMFLAFSPGAIQYSCLIKPDPGMIALTIAAFIYILKFSRAPSFKNIFLASSFSLAAVLFKYNAALIFIPFIIAVIPEFRTNWKDIIPAVCLSAGAVLISLLPVIGSASKSAAVLKTNFASTLMSNGQLLNPYFIRYFFLKGLGVLPSIAFISGLLYLTIYNPMKNILITSFLWGNIVFMLLVKTDYPQFTWCAMVFLCAIGAVFICGVFPYKWKKYMAGISVVLIVSNFYNVWALLSEHMTTDTRITAKKWIEQNIKPGEPLLYSMYGPPFSDYDPAINANYSLVDPARNAGYLSVGFTPAMLFGYKYYALAEFGDGSKPGFPRDFGRQIIRFKSKYEDRPDISIFENTKYYKYTPKTIQEIDLRNDASWHITASRNGESRISAYGKKGVSLIFKDTKRLDAYHFFIQHTDMNVVFDWDYTPDEIRFVRMIIDWSPDVRLDICFSDTGTLRKDSNYFVLEGKRGFGGPHEFVFPELMKKVNSIIFLINTPQNRRSTDKEYSVNIEKAEIVSIPPYYP
jgi:hypothetical protein